MRETKYLQVKAARLPRLGLYESHPSHPGGEVIVQGEETFTVAETPKVQEAIQKGFIERVGTATEVDVKKATKAIEDTRAGIEAAIRRAEQGNSQKETPEEVADRIAEIAAILEAREQRATKGG